MNKYYGKKIWIPIIALFVGGMVVLMERVGVTYEYTQNNRTQLVFSDDVEMDRECLILTSREEVSEIYETMMGIVLSDMKIAHESVSVENFDVETLGDYDTVVITFQEWGGLGENLPELFAWVKSGGNLMTAVTPVADGSFGAIEAKFGIISVGDEYPQVRGFRMLNDSMIGAPEDEVFWYVGEEEDGLYTSLMVELDEKCTVWMESEDGEVPLLWTRDYGDGTLALINEALSEKYQRGFLCLAYSMLGDAAIYPVINASAFYLDDFPSPVPGGNSTYIKRDYGVDTATFYSSIWWPKVLAWQQTYGIVHTGLIIEMYSDEVEAPFEENTATSQFLTFGNMLMNRGGELGFHGYNHMPLCLEGVDEEQRLGTYEMWKTTDDMKASLEELSRFSQRLFPANEFRVYVPPSNILSESGRAALLAACPSVNVIAATYLRDADGRVYEQEFDVAEDGIINTPRITSGCQIDDYQKISALSELNFHYVQSHFLHPDDVLDEDRGAEAGWEALSGEFETYLDWIYTSAPNIRNVTGSGMGTAVLQYDSLSMQRSYKGGILSVKLGGFSEEASFMLRVNKGTVTGAEGCTYEHVTGNLYMVETKQERFEIYLGE